MGEGLKVWDFLLTEPPPISAFLFHKAPPPKLIVGQQFSMLILLVLERNQKKTSIATFIHSVILDLNLQLQSFSAARC